MLRNLAVFHTQLLLFEKFAMFFFLFGFLLSSFFLFATKLRRGADHLNRPDAVEERIVAMSLLHSVFGFDFVPRLNLLETLLETGIGTNLFLHSEYIPNASDRNF